ncbi:hypothetical protein C1T28_00545 [Bacillus subtilis]|nr:hypothetical protein C1T28_00545 [Bacillus subtilis]
MSIVNKTFFIFFPPFFLVLKYYNVIDKKKSIFIINFQLIEKNDKEWGGGYAFQYKKRLIE